MTSIVNTTQAAALAGVTTSTIRSWVARGWLHPITPGSRPLHFHAEDVQRAAQRAQRKAHHDRLDTLWQRVLDRTTD